MATLALAITLSLIIGVSLGLLGGGGSILTVPILIYALGVAEKSAIASSLFIVGVTSAVAAVQHARAGNDAWGWAFDVAVGGEGSALAPFEIDFGIDELYRLTDVDPRARVFRHATLGARWHFAEHAKLMANWELRHIGTPSPDTPADARLIAESAADVVSLQLVATF